MDYITKNHSKYRLMSHLIFVCKYRKELLLKFGDEIKILFLEIAKESSITITEMKVDKNHIHFFDRVVRKEVIQKYIQEQG